MVAISQDKRKFEKGDKIIRQGEIANAAYLIKEGAARVYLQLENDEVEFSQLNVGDIFGEMALLRHRYHTLNVQAITDCEVLAVSPEHLDDSLKTADPLVKVILDALLDRVYKLDESFVSCQQFEKKVAEEADAQEKSSSEE